MNLKKLVFIGVLLAGVAVHIPSLGAWFNGDDFVHMKFLSGPWSQVVPKCLKGEVYDPNIKDIHYRPLSNLVMALMFHTKNSHLARISILMMHALIAFLLYQTAKLFIQNEAACQWAALFFFINGSLVHTIYWMTAVCDVLCSFFALLSIFFFFKIKSWQGPLVVVFFFLLSLFCKEMSITLPFALGLICFIRGCLSEKKITLICTGIAGFGFFLMRAIILGHFLAGNADDLYFSYLNIPVSLLKHLINIGVPFPLDWILRYPFLCGLVLVWAFLLLFPLWKGPKQETLMFVATIVISLLPVIGNGAKWYLYYPFIFITFSLATIIHSPVRSRWMGSAIILLFAVNLFATGAWSLIYRSSGDYQKKILQQVSVLSEEEITIIGMPRSLAGAVSLLSFKDDLQAALMLFYDKKMKIRYMVPCNIKNTVTHPILKKINQTVVLEFSSSGQNFFVLNNKAYEGSEYFFKPITFNSLGRPNSLRLDKVPTGNVYLYDGTFRRLQDITARL